MESNNPEVVPIIGLIFLIAGIIMGIVSVIMITIRRRKLEVYIHETDAVVINMKEKTVKMSDHHNRMWYPELEYIYKEQRHVITLNVGSNPPAYRMGDIIRIKVNTKNPEKIITVESKAFKTGFTIVTIMAVVYFIMGLIFIIAGSP